MAEPSTEPSSPPAGGPRVGEPPEDGSRSGFPWARAIAVLAALAMVLLWVYVLTRRPPIAGRLDEPTFPTAAQPICEATVVAVSQLPPAYEADTPAQRAADIAESNRLYREMLVQLEPLVPSGDTDDGRMVAEWLGDWRIYLGDREGLAERIAADPEARIFVTEKEKRQITEAIDRFAEVNSMAACATPSDLG